MCPLCNHHVSPNLGYIMANVSHNKMWLPSKSDIFNGVPLPGLVYGGTYIV